MPTRVLVVDDEPAIRELLTEYLRGRGMDVVPVADGESARARLERDPPDVVVTDLKLPGLDGIEVVQLAQARVPPVPAVMITGFGSVETTVAAFDAGVRCYLQKPFRLRDLYEQVQRVLADADTARRAAWAVAASELLLRAEIAADADAAEALVPDLLHLLEGAPLGAQVTLRDAPDAPALPLGETRWLDVQPLSPVARPYIRAVHEALLRAGR
ncbi:MAG: response regulator [Pseudomonadota bacterium]|nr:response regulator [Pseudomonadota bacterium]